MEEIRRIKQLMEEDRPVNWDSLPDIDLYMDQVVSYLSRQSTGGKAPVITSAMINNYVKDGLLPRANGKRYNREHLASLTAISLLKNVLTVKDMHLLLSQFKLGANAPQYDDFLSYVDEAFKGVDSALDADLSGDELARTALILALASCASKTACEHILSIIREQTEPRAEEPHPKKKDKDK